MLKQIVILFFLALSRAKCDVISLEEMKKAVPLHMENDPIFREKYPYLDVTDDTIDWRIVGGVESVRNSRNYQVGVYTPTPTGTGFCGASLITARTVMTAAHCVDTRVGNITFVLGAHNMPPQATDNAVLISTGNIIIHPGWNRNILLHDIALGIFDSPVTLSATIGTIPLPANANSNYFNQTALVSGWGRPSDDINTISPVLREVESVIIRNLPCRLAYMGLITHTHICLDGLGGRGTCNGDSGGPLVVGGVQIGVVSFGSSWGCAHGWPSGFARVTSYLDWIAQNSA